MPPPTNTAEKLHNLVSAEELVRKQRLDFFNSTVFSADRNIGAGMLFPSSWTPTVALDKAKVQENLKHRPDLKSQEAMLKQRIADAIPQFDKCTEDGVRWLVYRFGAIEIR